MKMRTINFHVSALLLMLIFSCQGMAQTDDARVTHDSEKKYTIIDLSTGESIDVYYDTLSWKTINRLSNQPVDYYIIRYADNTMMPDTVHGITGIIVNDLIVRNDANQWAFRTDRVKWDGTELKMKDKYGRKVKWEQGKLKIKDWNSKYKSEQGDDTKYKEEWDKIKWKDEEVKIERGAQKSKTRN
jgi:hypothetical protein